MKECTLFSTDLRTSQLVATASAALGLTVTFERVLPSRYPDQGLLLIATDLIPLSIPTRRGVLLLDREVAASDSSGSLVGIAGDDREAVTTLADRLGELVGGSPSSRLISITASAGGLGSTTLVALLGLASARAQQKTLLIDQSDRLHRVIGARSISIDCELQPVQPPRVGVLDPAVTVTSALLLDARERFDSVILGLRGSALDLTNTVDSLLLTANTALALEQGAAFLASADSRSVQIVLRQMSYGSFSTRQAAATLRARHIVEWPEDPTLSLAADLGDLTKAKHANRWATQIWSELDGRTVD